MTALPSPLAPRTRRLLEHRLASSQRDRRLPSVAAGLTRRSALAWTGAAGEVDDAVPSADTQYRIGSISKTLTALLVMRLREEGRLDLADRVDEHLTGTPFGDRTIGALLSHTAGLRAETAGPWWERTAGGDFAALMEPLGDEDLLHRAGRRFHYSNVGFALLGELVARLRGRSWGDCLQAEVLDPLEMRRTSLRPVAPYASGWAVHPFADVLLPEPEHDAGAMAPAGQVWSTVADLARLLAVLGGDSEAVLAPDAVAEMCESVAVEEEGTTPRGAYGLGVAVLWYRDRRLVGHGGSMPGFLAVAGVDRDGGDGVVVLTNTTAGLDPALPTDLLDLLAAEEPPVPETWRPAGPVDRAALELVGPWYWGPTALVMRLRGDGLLHLGPMDGAGRTSRFRSRGDGTWVGLDGYYAGETLRAVRTGGGGDVRSLDLGTFVLTRTPYDPKADVPGGVDPAGWR